jgi:predicted PurR-regulated permease PerM
VPIGPGAPIVPVIAQPLTYVQKVLIAVGISVAAVLLAILIYFTADLLILCFAGLLMAVFLSAPSDLLAKYARIKRSYALLAVMTALTMIVTLGGYFMGYTVYRQTKELARTLPGALKQFEGDLERLIPGAQLEAATDDPPATAPAGVTVMPDGTTLPAIVTTAPAAATAPAATGPAARRPERFSPRVFIAQRLIDLRQAATDFFTSETFVKRAGGVAGGVVSSTFGVIGNVVVVFGIGLFFALSPKLYAQGALRLLPVSRRARTATILSEVGTQLQWWFVGQLCSMTSIGILTFIGLKILGVPMAVTLGILAGLMNFIPNFGPILAAAPAVLVAFAPHGDQTQLNPGLAGWVILVYIVIQLLEGWVITPFFQQRAVELPPALIIMSQVLFGLLLGPIGLVLATPILATVMVLVRMVYVEDVLGDRAVDSP